MSVDTVYMELSDASRVLAGILLISLVTVETGGALMFKVVAGRQQATPLPLAALLLPGGFFLSATARGPEQPNRLVLLVPAGAVVLAVGLLTLGIGLLAA